MTQDRYASRLTEIPVPPMTVIRGLRIVRIAAGSYVAWAPDQCLCQPPHWAGVTLAQLAVVLAERDAQ